MNEFDYDVMLKKRIARGAIAKKNGCKRKKCTLPQDYMTAAELKRRNGKMETYSMNKPMKWREFKKAPSDVQREYVERMREEYNANDACLAKMFGVSATVVSTYFKEKNLRAGIARKMSKEEKNTWEKFLNPEEVSEPSDEPVKEEKQAEPKTEEKIRMEYCNLTVSGDVYGICKKIVEILGANTVGEISVTFRKEKEEIGYETF